MTKDGRPSPLLDIRLFRDGHRNYLAHDAATAFGRQVAFLLNAEGFSAGSFNSLYINLTRDLPDGEAHLSERHAEWWFRYVDVGVATDIPRDEGADPSAVPDSVVRATVAALAVVGGDRLDDLRAAAAIAKDEGDQIRFVVRDKDHARVQLRAATTIPVPPAPSDLYVLVEDRQTGRRAELPPITNGIYIEAFGEARGVALSDIEISGVGTDAFRADWSEAFKASRTNLGPPHDGPIPRYTGLVRRHF